MICRCCGKPMSTQEQAAYGERCEDCFATNTTSVCNWYGEMLGIPSPHGKRRAVKGGYEEVTSQANYSRSILS